MARSLGQNGRKHTDSCAWPGWKNAQECLRMLSDIQRPSQGSLGPCVSPMGAVSPCSKVSHTAPSKRAQRAPGWRVSQLTPPSSAWETNHPCYGGHWLMGVSTERNQSWGCCVVSFAHCSVTSEINSLQRKLISGNLRASGFVRQCNGPMNQL